MARRIASLGACLLLGACYSGLDDGPDGGGGPPAAADGRDNSDSADDGDDAGGDDNGQPDDDPTADECADLQVPSSRLRRLTRSAYANTVRDLLGTAGDVADSFEGDEVTAGFRNNIINPVSQPTVEDYMRAAEELSAEAVTDLEALVTCSPDDGEICAEAFITGVGRRAWRRPLQSDEIELLLGVYAGGVDFADGIRLVLQAMLESPYFIYHVELGDSEPDPDGVVVLSSYEIASRLSYLLWDSMPDDVLFEAAAADELGTAAQRRAQAERMLADPKARAAIASFHRQWLTLPEYELEQVTKSAERYPDFDAELRASMATEIELRSDYIIRHAGGSLSALVRDPLTFVDARLAELYGIDPVADAVDLPDVETLPDGWVAVSIDPAQRSGMLTQAGVLTALGTPTNSNIPLRGMFVAEHILCTSLEAPNDIPIDLPEPDPGATAREKLDQATAGPACSGCHSVINPLGFVLEGYGGIGERREVDVFDNPIDTTATVSTGDLMGDFEGPADFGVALADSSKFRGCVTQYWFQFAFGREIDGEADLCMYQAALDRLGEGDDVRELLLAFVEGQSFDHIRFAQ